MQQWQRAYILAEANGSAWRPKINDKDRNMKIISNSLHAHSSKVVGVCSRGAIPYNHCAKPNRAPSIPYALLCYLCFIK